jgi:GNAT superfamily N-acetyltransferase
MNKGPLFSTPTLLEENHLVDEFDCEKESLNSFLKKYALINSRAGSSKTYVTLQEDRVIGYYTIAPGSVRKEEAPERVKKGLANHPIPIILLARLAVDENYKGIGLGKALLRDALSRMLAAANSIGGRAILVHAKDEEAKSFYTRFGFETGPIDPLHLYLLIKDIKKTLGI